jgi:hypothetical protein
MRKSILISGSILCLFIFCSLSIQPIIADEHIESIPIVDDTKTSDIDRYDLRELYSRLVKYKYQSDDDCGCLNKSRRGNTPLICQLLNIIFFPYWLFYYYIIIPTSNDFLHLLFLPPIWLYNRLYWDIFECG